MKVSAVELSFVKIQFILFVPNRSAGAHTWLLTHKQDAIPKQCRLYTLSSMNSGRPEAHFVEVNKLFRQHSATINQVVNSGSVESFRGF